MSQTAMMAISMKKHLREHFPFLPYYSFLLPFFLASFLPSFSFLISLSYSLRQTVNFVGSHFFDTFAQANQFGFESALLMETH